MLNTQNDAASLKYSPTLPVPAPTQRLLCIDVLRGLTVAFMILVNNPGDGKVGYWPLEHAPWNGWTPTDLVFPTFLFLVGCSIVFSIGSRLKRGVPKSQIIWQVTKRSFWILVINFAIRLLPDFHDLHHVRFFGVLPRIAIVYFFAALIYLLSQRTRSLVGWVAALLVGYYLLVRFAPIPGIGVPGRDVPFMDQYNNITAYIDRGFNNWTIAHLHTGSLYVRYRDPEGWLSTLPAIGTSILGILAGKLIRSERSAARVRNLLLAGGATSVVFGLACSTFFPINKNMWTSSFVLLAAGITSLLLGLFYQIFDVNQAQRTSKFVRVFSWPWLVFGSNAIAAYVLAEIWGKIDHFIPMHDGSRVITLLPWLYKYGFAHSGSSANTSLAFACFYVVLCFLPVSVLWRKGIFLRV